MTKVRPRSLLQVVLMGFVLVLMPLGGMIWHDSQALEHLSQLTSDELERAVRDTRRATLLTTQAIDLERTLRRYAVLGDERILASYQQQLASYRSLLAAHQGSIPDAEAYTGLEQVLAEHGARDMAMLTEFMHDCLKDISAWSDSVFKAAAAESEANRALERQRV